MDIKLFLKTGYYEVSYQQTSQNHSVDPQSKLSTAAFQTYLSIESSACFGQKQKRLGEWGKAYQGLSWWALSRICLQPPNTAARLSTLWRFGFKSQPCSLLSLSGCVPLCTFLNISTYHFLVCKKGVMITVDTSKNSYEG